MLKTLTTVASVALPIEERWSIKRCRYAPDGESVGRVCIATGTHGDEMMGQLIVYLVQQRIAAHPDALRGTVDFQRGAKRGVGHESEDVLLFSPNARNRTAPLILCGEEEVEGQHAASVGRLDENKLYYLRSRGLSEAQARRLMVDARFAPAIDKIPLESLQDEVRENVAGRLNDELDG